VPAASCLRVLRSFVRSFVRCFYACVSEQMKRCVNEEMSDIFDQCSAEKYECAG